MDKKEECIKPKSDDKLNRLSSAVDIVEKMFANRLKNHKKMKKLLNDQAREEVALIREIKDIFQEK